MSMYPQGRPMQPRSHLNFIYLNPIPIRGGGRFCPPSQRSHLNFPCGYVPVENILLIRDMVVELWNRQLGCKSIHHKITKIYFNEFVANVLSDNMGMIIFDILGCGGCQRTKTLYFGAHFGTLTQCLALVYFSGLQWSTKVHKKQNLLI